MQKPDSQEWTTSSLRQLLGKYISAMEMAGGGSHNTLSQSGHVPFKRRPLQHRSAEGLLAAGSQQLPSQVCVLCAKPLVR